MSLTLDTTLKEIADSQRILDETRYWELEKLKEQVIKLRLDNRKESKQYILRKPVIDTLDALGPRLAELFIEDFAKDMPEKHEGMSANQLREEYKKIAHSILSIFKKPADDWRAFKDMPKDETVNDS